MKVVVTGGSGFIGRALLPALVQGGHEVVLLTREPRMVQRIQSPGLQIAQWDGNAGGPWQSLVDGADAVLNFAGESIGAKRWSKEQKERIVGSRVNATRAIVNAIRGAGKKPRVLINGSAIGFYGDVPEGDVTEERRRGEGFLAETVNLWEQEARTADPLGARVVMARMGVVLGDDGGALARMLLPFKLYAGGPIGSGRQWFSWIHRDDVVGAVLFAMMRQTVSGPVNVTAPQPATMKEFCAALGRALHRPSWAPVPAFMMRFLLGEMSEMVLTGQRVIPSRLIESGYVFKFPQLKEALENIMVGPTG